MTSLNNIEELNSNIEQMKQLCNLANKSFKNYRIDITYKLADSLSKNMGIASELGNWITNNEGAVYFSCIKSHLNQAIVNYDSGEDEEILYMDNNVISTNLGKDKSNIQLNTERRTYVFFDGEDEDARPSPTTVTTSELDMH